MRITFFILIFIASAMARADFNQTFCGNPTGTVIYAEGDSMNQLRVSKKKGQVFEEVVLTGFVGDVKDSQLTRNLKSNSCDSSTQDQGLLIDEEWSYRNVVFTMKMDRILMRIFRESLMTTSPWKFTIFATVIARRQSLVKITNLRRTLTGLIY